MKATVIVSAVLISATLAVSAYILKHGANDTPVADEPSPEMQDVAPDLESAITLKSIHIRDTLKAIDAGMKYLVDTRDNAHATVIHSHRRAVLQYEHMDYVRFDDERDMYKQMARERIDVALEQYRHGSAGK